MKNWSEKCIAFLGFPFLSIFSFVLFFLFLFFFLSFFLFVFVIFMLVSAEIVPRLFSVLCSAF